MNIKQAKIRFAELTGIYPESRIVHRYAKSNKWLQRGLAYVADNSKNWKCDCRHKEFWVLLVEYLEDYGDIKEVR